MIMCPKLFIEERGGLRDLMLDWLLIGRELP